MHAPFNPVIAPQKPKETNRIQKAKYPENKSQPTQQQNKNPTKGLSSKYKKEIFDFQNKFLFKDKNTLAPNIYTKNFGGKGKYTGNLSKSGMREGTGMFEFEKNSDVYVGEWHNDLFHGNGSYYFDSGEKYVGRLERGKKDGEGTYVYNNGNSYNGHWVEDFKHGSGEKVYANKNERFKGSDFSKVYIRFLEFF
jgi:hypothetical protein